jgi:Fe-S cluster assembly protein SufB
MHSTSIESVRYSASLCSLPGVSAAALLLDEHARTDTYPTIRVGESETEIGHEATVSKVGEDQLFYLMSRGLDKSEAYSLTVNSFIESITKELPMEYAVEQNRLIQLEMSGSVGQADSYLKICRGAHPGRPCF